MKNAMKCTDACVCQNCENTEIAEDDDGEISGSDEESDGGQDQE